MKEECDEDITFEEVYGTFWIRKKVSPPSIIYDDKKDDLLRRCLNTDFAWVLTVLWASNCVMLKNLSHLGSGQNLWSKLHDMKPRLSLSTCQLCLYLSGIIYANSIYAK